MRPVLSAYAKEVRAYLVSPIPYVFAIVFVAFTATWFFVVDNFFFNRAATMDGFFRIIPWAFVFLVPAITMRLWSEEARAGTMETLLTMPVRAWQLVLGKFLSAWTLLFACLVATLPLAITVSSLGDLDWGPVLGAYAGTLFMGGALLALGLWVSSLTGHQIVAFLVTMILGLSLVLLGYFASSLGPGGWGRMADRISVQTRYDAMGRGVIDLRDVLYFASFAALFLYLNALTVENRRYR